MKSTTTDDRRPTDGIRPPAPGVFFAVLCGCMLFASAAKAEGKIYSGQVRGESVERIDGSDHTVERYVGRPDGHSADYQLKQLAVAVAPEDQVDAFPNPSLGLGSAIRITRANRVTVIDGGEATEYRTWVGNVRQLIDERKVELGDDDVMDKNKEETIVDTMTIVITRVQLTEVEERESIAFKTITVDDATMDKGETKLLEKGKAGARLKRFRLRRENGKLVEKALLSTETVSEPITERVAKGTKVVSYGSGAATWYALKSGLGAAHNTLPKGAKVRVTNLANGKSVDVVINDHGIHGNVMIDLTKEAFETIAPLGAGRIQVRLEKDYD